MMMKLMIWSSLKAVRAINSRRKECSMNEGMRKEVLTFDQDSSGCGILFGVLGVKCN
jgi:hypothetical protein